MDHTRREFNLVHCIPLAIVDNRETNIRCDDMLVLGKGKKGSRRPDPVEDDRGLANWACT